MSDSHIMATTPEHANSLIPGCGDKREYTSPILEGESSLPCSWSSPPAPSSPLTNRHGEKIFFARCTCAYKQAHSV